MNWRSMAAGVVVWWLLAGVPAAAAEKPNIIFILADDLGWTDLGCAGSGYYETPHLDRMAAEGMSFLHYVVCQNCAPTRAALMSGQYPPRTGIYTVGTLARGRADDRRMTPPENETRLPLRVATVADALRKAGYATGMFGKWHLGNGPDHHPSRRGFDEAVVADGRHFGFRTDPAARVDPDVYLADYLTGLAEDFVRRHREEPFFLYLPHFAVHSPLQAKEEDISWFEGKPRDGGHRRPVYAAMIRAVDASVGRLQSLLRELGLREKTVVFFSSDNGGVGGYRLPGTWRRGGTTENAPLREGKGSLYEGGVRVPLLAAWPGVIAGGRRSGEALTHVDFFPTLVRLAGGELPAGQVCDGVDFSPLLRGEAERCGRDAIFQHFPGYLESYIPEQTWRTTPVSTVRSGRWKLLEFLEDRRVELYDLENDLGETRDVAGVHPQVVAALRAKLERWRGETGAAMPASRDVAACGEDGR